MFISVIIPNFNGKELLENNLPKVIREISEFCKNKKKHAEIIIVDDASTDESVAYLEEFQKKHESSDISFKYYVNPKNKGFAKTVNIGVSHATGEFLLLLNTDVSPEKNFLEPLIEHTSDEKTFAVGCLDKSIEHGKVVKRGRGIGKWHQGFLIHSAGELERNNTLWVSGGSGLFRKDIWEKLGGLNELYSPFYWEDIDISYRALKAGYTICFEKNSTVIHEHEKGAIKNERNKQYIQTIAYRNQMLFVWLNITDRSLLINHLLWLPVQILRAIKRNDMAFIKGFIMACSHVIGVLEMRKKMKKVFIRHDKEILSEYNI